MIRSRGSSRLLRRGSAASSRSAWRWIGAAAGIVWVSGCSVGVGDGEVVGSVMVPSCELEGSYDLEASYFAAEPIEEQLEIKIQRGSDFEGKSDGVAILVRDAARVRRDLLNADIEITNADNAQIRIGFYLNETCPVGRDERPVAFEAVGGTINFRNIYAPEINEDDVEVAGAFSNVTFTDSAGRTTWNAVLSGRFRFLYDRGRPSQRFP